MPAWVASLSQDVGPTNWDLCVEHRLMGARSRASGAIRAGDDVFIWLAPTGLIAWTRALEDAVPSSAGRALPWPDPDAYSFSWRMAVVDDRVVDPPSVRWGELRAAAGITASGLNVFPRVPEAGVAVLASHFVDSTRDETLVERMTVQALPVEDQRRYREATRAVREGQQGFRDKLDQAYGGRCAITGTSERTTLEAAHITRYLGAASNQTRNGLLLRSDLHALFDAFLLTVTPEGVVRVAGSVISQEYRRLDGRSIHLPSQAVDRPDVDELGRHLARFSSQHG